MTSVLDASFHAMCVIGNMAAAVNPVYISVHRISFSKCDHGDENSILPAVNHEKTFEQILEEHHPCFFLLDSCWMCYEVTLTGWVDRGRLDFGSSADKYSIFVGCHRHTKNCRDSHGHFCFKMS